MAVLLFRPRLFLHTIYSSFPAADFLPHTHSAMNLMDMLAGDPVPEDALSGSILPLLASYATDLANDIPAMLDSENSESEALLQPKNGVYHLPTVLTHIQKELSEVVLQIFHHVLLAEAHSKRLRASISSLLDSGENGHHHPLDLNDGSLDFYDKVSLLFDQLRIIDRHPSLLVDHFMPKKLLLLEISERLLTMSGKLQLFDRIVNALVERFPKKEQPNFRQKVRRPVAVFHVLVIAESVKELELIEGLIIGKNLRYTNLSSRKLYDDKLAQIAPKYESRIKEEDAKERKRRRWRSPRHNSPKVDVPEPPLHLHLITSQQLYNNYTHTANKLFDLLFLFDADLDTSGPSVELIRSNHQLTSLLAKSLKTPILIPIPIFSLEHIILHSLPRPTGGAFGFKDTSSALFKWKAQVINSFVVNRFRLYEENHENEFYRKNYGSNMEKLFDWFHNWDEVKYPFQNQRDIMDSYNEQLTVYYSDEKLIKKLDVNYLDKVDSDTNINGFNIDVFDYDGYKRKFAQVLNDRITQIELFAKEKTEDVLPALRRKESERQTAIDEDEEAIATNYRKLRKLNDDAAFTERKMNKADADLTKAQQNYATLEDKLQSLLENSKKETSDIEKLVEEQEKLLKTLEEEATHLDDEFDRINEENESNRANYQSSSAEAVQLSATLASLKEQNEKLRRKLEGPGMSKLPSLMKKDELASFEQQLSKLNKENGFMLLYFGEKLDKLIKERNVILDSTASGSSSRPTNRVSRGGTPM